MFSPLLRWTALQWNQHFITTTVYGWPRLKPQRFDIIAFPSPRNGQRVAKRLIGLPGETVEYRDDTLYINGVSLSEDYLASAKRNVSKNENYTQDFTLETLEATQSLTVPEGMYFVLGIIARAQTTVVILALLNKRVWKVFWLFVIIH